MQAQEFLGSQNSKVFKKLHFTNRRSDFHKIYIHRFSETYSLRKATINRDAETSLVTTEQFMQLHTSLDLQHAKSVFKNSYLPNHRLDFHQIDTHGLNRTCSSRKATVQWHLATTLVIKGQSVQVQEFFGSAKTVFRHFYLPNQRSDLHQIDINRFIRICSLQKATIRGHLATTLVTTDQVVQVQEFWKSKWQDWFSKIDFSHTSAPILTKLKSICSLEHAVYQKQDEI